jgi:hypothetical protein
MQFSYLLLHFLGARCKTNRHPVKNSPPRPLQGTQGLLPHSATSLHPKQKSFSLQHTPNFFKIHLNTVFLSIPRSSNSDFPLGFSTKLWYAFVNLPLHTTFPAHFVLHNVMKSTNYEALHYAVFFFRHLLTCLSQVQILPHHHVLKKPQSAFVL